MTLQGQVVVLYHLQARGLQYRIDRGLQCFLQFQWWCHSKLCKLSKGITAQTPRSKTNQLIRDSGLTPRKVPAGIKKKLIYANVVEDELQTAAKKSDQHKEVLTEPLTLSPDVFVKSYQTEEAVKGLVDKVTATEVTVQQKVLDARDDKRRVKVVSTQYTQLRQLKENLPANRIIIIEAR